MSAAEIVGKLNDVESDVLVAKVDLVDGRVRLSQAIGKLIAVDGDNPLSYSLRSALVALEDSIQKLDDMSGVLTGVITDVNDYKNQVR